MTSGIPSARVRPRFPGNLPAISRLTFGNSSVIVRLSPRCAPPRGFRAHMGDASDAGDDPMTEGSHDRHRRTPSDHRGTIPQRGAPSGADRPPGSDGGGHARSGVTGRRTSAGAFDGLDGGSGRIGGVAVGVRGSDTTRGTSGLGGWRGVSDAGCVMGRDPDGEAAKYHRGTGVRRGTPAIGRVRDRGLHGRSDDSRHALSPLPGGT